MNTTHQLGKLTFAQHPTTFNFKHSKHSRERACQRAIAPNMIDLVLIYGTTIYRQGMAFLTVFGKDIPKGLRPSLKQKLKNIVVLLGTDGKKIVTCYRCKNAVKYLRKKQKQLY